MYEAPLVALNLEVCQDALQAAQRTGNEAIARPLQRPLRLLLRQLNLVEVGGAARAAAPRAGAGAKAAPRSGG
jgi:hypothetical protein